MAVVAMHRTPPPFHKLVLADSCAVPEAVSLMEFGTEQRCWQFFTCLEGEYNSGSFAVSLPVY